MYTHSGTTMPADVDLVRVSATNNAFTAEQTEAYNDDSTFYGWIDATNWQVVIWKLVERDEQTTDDGSFIRIENARELSCVYKTTTLN